LRRAIRLVPLYFIFTSVAFLIAIVAPAAARSIDSSPYDYFRSILFIPFVNPKTNIAWPILSQGWTLNFEVFFYLIFAACLFLRREKRLLVCSAILVLLVAARWIVRPADAIASTYTNSRLIEFVFGMVIGYIVSAHPAKLASTALVFSIAGLLAIGAYIVDSTATIAANLSFFFGLPCAAIVCGLLWLELNGKVPQIPALILAGDASYSLYLGHIFVLSVLRRPWSLLNPLQFWTHATFIVSCAIASVGFSIMTFLWLERPLTKRLMHYARRWHSQPKLVIAEGAVSAP
jgi:exopolysaccharide production protein ExoZ